MRKPTVLGLLITAVLAGCGGPLAARSDDRPAATLAPPRDFSDGEGLAEERVAAIKAAPAVAVEGEAGIALASEPKAAGAEWVPRSPQQASLKAGEVDDNEQWDGYLLYRREHGRTDVHDVDVSERYVITVVDAAGRTVHDARVSVSAAGGRLLFEGVADAGGRVLFHPRAFPAAETAQSFSVQALDPADTSLQATVEFPREPALSWEVVLPGEQTIGPVRLDMLFLMDATGSMGDEIDALKSTLLEISAQIDALPERPDVRFGLVTYRDREDLYVTRVHEFTADVVAFHQTLSAVTANGGGDYPESLNEALHAALHGVTWRDSKTVRLVLLIADAPPHLDYQQDYDYAEEMVEASRLGIKVFPIASSGLDDQGEYVYRQIAQFTGGKFIFLTYSPDGTGPGEETDHHVEDYTVQKLDALVVRLIQEELARLSR